ncbi:MAG: response regulator [Candidatus Omnitrophica bacterium]|nr:response regulator [Candidatus Omnitrophota bacterium]
MKIRGKVLLATSIVMMIGASLTITWFYYSIMRNTVQQVSDANDVLSGAIHKAVCVFMDTGEQGYLDSFLGDIEKMKSIGGVRVVRSEILKKELKPKGNAPPEDDIDRQVVSSGEKVVKQVSLDGERGIRTTIPVVAARSCLECHTLFKEGETMAALSTIVIFQSSFDNMVRNLVSDACVQGVIILIVAAVILLILNKIVLGPLITIGSIARKFGKGDWSAANEVELMNKRRGQGGDKQGRLDEVDELACSIRDMFRNLQDITVSRNALNLEVEKRKTVERELRESGERIRAITTSAQDGVIMMDPEGNISFWNPAAEKIFGHSWEEVRGRNLHALLAPSKYLAAHGKAFQSFRRTGKGAAVDKVVELEGRHKDGSEFPIELSLSTVLIEEKWHAVGVVRDISVRKHNEQKLAEAKTAAEQASKAKSEFLANMSHEIRTPMNGVIGMTGLLIDTDLDPEQKRMAEVVRSSGEMLLALINDILDYSKIEADKMDLEIMDFDMRGTIDDTMDMLAIKAFEKDLDFMAIVEENVPLFVKGDPGRLRQIMINLIGNAIKFTKKGEVSLRVEVISTNENMTALRFTVKDTGIGISKDKVGALFQSFQQADASVTREFGGTGLGLAISKRIVQKMGGQIFVESEQDKGTSFFFTVSFERQDRPEARYFDVPVELEGMNILVVDDNANNRLLLNMLLSKAGARVSEVSDGNTAHKAVSDAVKNGDPYEVVIMDLQMPFTSGETAGRAIKEDPVTGNTILIMLTSHGQKGDAKKLEALGFSGYLVKPVRRDRLFECLRMSIGRKKLGERGITPPKEIITAYTIRERKKEKIRILVVEDNKTNQDVAVAILGKLGYRSDVAANGEEAIKMLEMISYDLVLMDCQMPVMDGYTASGEIRKMGPAVRDVTIVAMTANALAGDREKCLNAGMTDYISKPVSPADIMKILAKYLPKDKA